MREENVLDIARRVLERRVLVSEETQLADAVERMAAALRRTAQSDDPAWQMCLHARDTLRELGIPLHQEDGDE